MVRGGARIKAGGGNMAQDSPRINKPLALNMSLFQFLKTGYFEKDLLTYCANRLVEYSCTYWLDPTVNGNADSMNFNMASTTTSALTYRLCRKRQNVVAPKKNFFVSTNGLTSLYILEYMLLLAKSSRIMSYYAVKYIE
ncbi:unnamed protein product [Heterobilharzia americana]|nr:unnamed protein product [Heterobilharzia americana]